MLRTTVKGPEITTADSEVAAGAVHCWAERSPWRNKAWGGGETEPAAGLCKLCGGWFLGFS